MSRRTLRAIADSAPEAPGRRATLRASAAYVASAVLHVGCKRQVALPAGGDIAETAQLPPFGRQVPATPRADHTLVRISLDAANGGPAEIAVLVPNGKPGDTYPVVIALHGRGEAQKDPTEGCLGWPRDYALERAMNRLGHGPLNSADFEDLAQPAHLRAYNTDLANKPYQGLVVVCPYMPDFDLRKDVAMQLRYGRFLVESVLPRIREQLPVIPTAACTGIDGVSLGGLMAMRVGFKFAEYFGAVGGIQPAIQSYEAEDWTQAAVAAHQKNAAQKIRLMTSDKDYFQDAVVRCAQTFARAGVPHELINLPGPHDYIFNRTLGAYELLRFHSRALQRPSLAAVLPAPSASTTGSGASSAPTR
jgi:iron(III)-salmochelin esterase